MRKVSGAESKCQKMKLDFEIGVKKCIFIGKKNGNKNQQICLHLTIVQFIQSIHPKDVLTSSAIYLVGKRNLASMIKRSIPSSVTRWQRTGVKPQPL